MTNLAIAHKDYSVYGGGERVVEELARMYDAPIYTGFVADDVTPVYDDIREIYTSRSQSWAIKRGGLPRALAYNLGWQNESRLTQYDTIVTSGNEPLWYVPEPEQTLIAYCHTPPRPQYDLNHHSSNGAISTLLRSLKRTWFQHNIERPDLWIANGEEVARRMNQSWGIDYDNIRVVYPPIDTDVLKPNNAETQDYYLYLGRLGPHKRVDIAVGACNDLELPLVVAGDGSERTYIESIATEDVDCVGYVSEQRKRELLAGAKAVLMPAEREDFGMVPIEAMASGTPVIGVNEGMTKSQIIHGANGLLSEGTLPDFRHRVNQFEKHGVAWSESRIRQYAVENSSKKHFRENMRDAIEHAREKAHLETDFATVEEVSND